MGKRLIQQARGKGGPTYRAPSFRYYGKAKFRAPQEPIDGTVRDFVKCPGHTAPLAAIEYDDKKTLLLIAPEGLKVGDRVTCGATEIAPGNILELQNIPVGTVLFNIESQPGDGGKFCRSSGTFARLVEKSNGMVSVELPSKKIKKFKASCRASVGIVAGGGRKEKPLLKAGKAYHRARARNKLYPRTTGVAMNAIDHPHGGTASSNIGRPSIAPKNAPPGRKVGKIRPKRTGYRR